MAEINAAYKALCDNLSAETDLKALWPLFKEQHNRQYSDEEDVQRFERFAQNVTRAIEHNAKFQLGEVKFQMGINKFTDMYEDEMKPYCGKRQ